MALIRSPVVAVAAALVVAACARDSLGPGPASIAGTYRLSTVDGRVLPCCGTGAAGDTTTVGGYLTLDRADPEKYVVTPAGMMAGSCVHEIPNGATVDAAGVVHRPDGTSYRLPVCGSARFVLVLMWRIQREGGSELTADTTTGRYTWGRTGTSEDATNYVTLVGSAFTGGAFPGSGGMTIRLTRSVFGMPWPGSHEYAFTSP